MALTDYIERPARQRVRLDDITDLLPPDEKAEVTTWCAADDGGLPASQIAVALTNAAKKHGRPDLRISASSMLDMRRNSWEPL